MRLLVIIIALELVFTLSILGLSSNAPVLSKTKYKISQVLGIKKIVQVEDKPSPSPDSPAQDSSIPLENSSPGATPAPSAGDISSPRPTEAPLPTGQTIDTSDPFGQTLNPSPTLQDQFPPNPESSGQTSSQASPSLSSIDNNGVTQTAVVLNPADLINSADNINSRSVEGVKKEEDQLRLATDPGDQTKLLISFATDKVKDMNNFIKVDDFASVSFATSRFNDQINQAINNLTTLSPKQQIQFKNQLINFCDQADKILRTVQLSVPEQSEQDLEMARGQCQELEP